MNKYLKFGLWALAGVVGIFAVAVLYIALTFDPNSYKPQIIQAVRDHTQRTLRLDGDIKLFFFPNVGVNIGHVALSEHQSNEEFASVESLRVSLALMSLLSRQVVVNEIAVDGVKARIIKFKDGKTNLDDLLGKSKSGATSDRPPATETPVQPVSTAAPIALDIASVRIENTAISYRDESSGAQYTMQELSLITGRIAGSKPASIEFSAHMLANQPSVDILAKIKTTLTADLEKMQFSIDALDIQANGKALDFSDLNLKLGANASAQMEAQQFSLNKFHLTASGLKGKDRFAAKLDLPAASLDKGALAAEGIALDAKLEAAFANIAATLAIPGIEGTLETFKLDKLELNVQVKQAEQQFKLKLTTPITGNLKTQQFNLADLQIALNATGEKLPGKNIDSVLKGSVQADIGRESIQANLAGGFLHSQLKAKAAINNFAAPVIRYDLEIDQFDADPFMPKTPAKTEVAKETQALPEQPFDLSALKALNVEGSVRIGALKAANVKVKQLRVDVKAKGGVVKVAPFSANLYGGSIASDISVNAAKAQPQFAVNAKLNGIEIGPLLNDALKLDFVGGKGNVALNLTTQGDKVSLLKKNLGGTMALSLADGAVKGINLAKSLRGVGIGGSKDQTADTAEKTDFSEMKASFTIRNGVAHNEDLMLKSPYIRVGGKGDIDLGNDSLDYLVKATIARTSEGQGGRDDIGGLTVPVRASGPFTALKFKLDFGAAASEATKQKAAAAASAAKEKAQQALDASKEQAKEKAKEELKKGLKGLFK